MLLAPRSDCLFNVKIRLQTNILGYTVAQRIQLGLASAMYEGLYNTETFILPTKSVRTLDEVPESDLVRRFMQDQDVTCSEIIHQESTYKAGDLGNA